MAALVPIAVLGVFVLAACDGDGEDRAFEVWRDDGNGKENLSAPNEFTGAKVTPAIPKPDFTLTDTDSEAFDIPNETEGYVTLMYFGYTNCPDICPTHMQDIAATLQKMSEEQRAQVKVLFVTTDPERDTPERLREWLDLFNEDFIGLTGTEEQLADIQRAVGTNAAQKEETQRSGSDGYDVAHAAYVIAFTKETNTAPLVYPSGITRDTWLNDLTKLVEEGYGDGGD